jgi:hypothetical protein
MFHKMNSKSCNVEARNSKRRKESKLLDVLMAARALSSIGGSDEEKSVQNPDNDHKRAKHENDKIPKETEEETKEVVDDEKHGKEEEDNDKKESEKTAPDSADAKEASEEDEEEDCDEPTTIKTFPEKVSEEEE